MDSIKNSMSQQGTSSSLDVKHAANETMPMSNPPQCSSHCAAVTGTTSPSPAARSPAQLWSALQGFGDVWWLLGAWGGHTAPLGLLSSVGTKYLLKVSKRKPKLTPWKIHSSGLELFICTHRLTLACCTEPALVKRIN